MFYMKHPVFVFKVLRTSLVECFAGLPYFSIYAVTVVLGGYTD